MWYMQREPTTNTHTCYHRISRVCGMSDILGIGYTRGRIKKADVEALDMKQWYICDDCDYEFVRVDVGKEYSKCPICDKPSQAITVGELKNDL